MRVEMCLYMELSSKCTCNIRNAICPIKLLIDYYFCMIFNIDKFLCLNSIVDDL